MASVPYSNYVADISPHVVGCPTAVIVQYIRKVFSDLCDRTLCWRAALTDLPVVAGTSSYTLTSPVVDTEVLMPLNIQLISASNPSTTQTINLLTYEQAMSLYPDWPNTSTPGVPEIAFQRTPGELCLAPVPDALDTYTLRITAALRPTNTAEDVEDTVINPHKRAVFHGAVHELMMIPAKSWSNDKLAAFHGKQWGYFLYTARAKANKGFGRANLNVVQRPWA